MSNTSIAKAALVDRAPFKRISDIQIDIKYPQIFQVFVPPPYGFCHLIDIKSGQSAAVQNFTLSMPITISTNLLRLAALGW